MHNAVTAPWCLQLPPFRYWPPSMFLFFIPLLSFSSASLDTPGPSSEAPLLRLHRFFPYMRSRRSDKSDVFLLFSTSCPPTSFLSSVLVVHTVFPTYTLCSECNTHAVAHTHRPQSSTHLNCSTLAPPRLNCSIRHIAINLSHTYLSFLKPNCEPKSLTRVPPLIAQAGGLLREWT